MENVSEQSGLFVENSAGNAFAVIEKNISRVTALASAAAEKSLAYIREQAAVLSRAIVRETDCNDILQAVLSSDEAVRIYRESLKKDGSEPLFGDVNRAEEPFFGRQADRFRRFYLCKCIAENGQTKTLAPMIPWVCGPTAQVPAAREKKIAFLRNRQASRAFECFAKYLGGVSAVYEDNFQNACESVYTGEATYAIVPIASTTDGRLNSFYKQMEKYDLNIVLTCDVESDDGETVTTFALVYRDRIYPDTDGEPLYECKITFEKLSDLSDVVDAATYFGVRMESVEALPMMFSGRAGTFSMIFGLSDADVGGFLCYLALEYPQTAAVGVYTRVGGRRLS